MERRKEIIKTSSIAIAINVILVAIKGFLGILSGSVAILLDAINNLSDALSSVITIVGTQLAGRAPDKKHPYGYGRIEYMTAIILSVVVLLAGISSFRESFDHIVHPVKAHYSSMTLMVIALAVIVKYVLGMYTKKKGEKLHSKSLVASGTEALFDAIISLSTLMAALLSIFLQLNIEGYLGAIISILIIKAGLEILLESIGNIIGTRVDSDLITELKQQIEQYEAVLGVYDVVLHQYGPEHYIGSVHIEVEDKLTAKEIHTLTRVISQDIYQHYGIIMTIGIYAANTEKESYEQIKMTLNNIIDEYPEILQMHGFYVEEDSKMISFDLVIAYTADDPIAIKEKVVHQLTCYYPNYRYFVIIDNDFSESNS